MIKRISVDQLCRGMYIHDLNCGWLDHDFLSRRFSVKTDAQLAKIRALGVYEVYIDTSRGKDVADAPTQQEVEKKLDQAMGAIIEAPQPEPPPMDPQDARVPSLTQQRLHAEKIQKSVVGIIGGMMNSIRLGHQVDVERTRPMLGQMVDSIFLNQDALLGLQRIRRVDAYTFEHSVNVAVLMMVFGRSLDLERGLVEELGLGALLHDIGKSLTPLEILNKPGQLDDQELVVMRRHAIDGEQILASAPGVSTAALSVAAEHHERMDGGGYPHQRAAGEISNYGRMAAIVDVYDALTADRVYHKAMEPTRALRKLFEWSEYHFDPQFVQLFIQAVGIYPVGSLVRLSSGRIGVVVESNRNHLLLPVVRVFADERRRCYIDPIDIDLSQDSATGQETILAGAPDDQWPVNLRQIMTLPLPL